MIFLLERLAVPAGQSQAFDLRAAVAAQLQRIVGARVIESGDGEMSLLEFGMPSVVDLASHSMTALQTYAARLARLIRHYEPRLLNSSVVIEPTANSIAPYRLVVTGSLEPDGELQTYVFDLPEH